MKLFREFPTSESDHESYEKLNEMADIIERTLPVLYAMCEGYVELSASHPENVTDVRVYAFKEMANNVVTGDYILYVSYLDNGEPFSQIVSLESNLPEVPHFIQYHWDSIQTIAERYEFIFDAGGE